VERKHYSSIQIYGLQQPLHAAAGGPALALRRFCLFCLAAHCLRLKAACHVGLNTRPPSRNLSQATSCNGKRCLQFVNYNEMIAAAEEKVKRKSGTQTSKQAAFGAAIYLREN